MIVKKDQYIFNERLPNVTIVIPTLNEEKRIRTCLNSVFSQDYPTGKMEVIVVDGMSSDDTVKIAKQYRVDIVPNPKRIYGNAQQLGLKKAKNEIIVFLDADVELLGTHWLKRMVAPILKDQTIAGSIPLIVAKREHSGMSRCYALLQADPFVSSTFHTAKSIGCFVIGKDNYFPMGGTGVFRKDVVLTFGGFKPYLPRMSDVDMTYRLTKNGYKFVIVPEAQIYHFFAENFPSFLRKTYSRIHTFIKYHSYCDFQFIPKGDRKIRFIKTVFSTITPLILVRTAKGIRKDRDRAWLYYPLIALSIIFLYTIMLITSPSGLRTLKKIFVE